MHKLAAFPLAKGGKGWYNSVRCKENIKIASERKWDLKWKAEVARQAQRKAATNGGRRAGPGSRSAAGKRRREFSLPL